MKHLKWVLLCIHLSPVEKLLIENGHVNGVLIRSGSSTKIIKGDAVVLAAGGVGTAQILKASGLEAQRQTMG